MKYYKQFITLFVCCVFIFSVSSFAQSTQQRKKINVAVLCPLYLDSAFNGYSYSLSKTSMPQFLLAGLDFYNGIMLAVDELNKENINAEVWIYDTQKKNADIYEILRGMKVLDVSLIIGSFSNGNEQKAVSDFSFENNIPVISVTYPNDLGITANPYFTLLNATLKTHVDGIYKYLQQSNTGTKPLFITRSGNLENKILSDFKANDKTARNKLNYNVVPVNSEVYFENIKPYLDSNRQNVIVCGSLNSTFALSVLDALAENPGYKATLVGMPNWDGIKKLYTGDNPNVEIVYSTPYKYDPTDSKVREVTAAYRSQFYARPSDLVFKSYEAMVRYTKVAAIYKNEFIGHLSDPAYKWINDFYMSPVFLTSKSLLPDYFENKNLYFIRKSKQAIVSVTPVKMDGKPD